MGADSLRRNQEKGQAATMHFVGNIRAGRVRIYQGMNMQSAD